MTDAMVSLCYYLMGLPENFLKDIMAAKEKSLVIVESPAKSKTIKKMTIGTNILIITLNVNRLNVPAKRETG